MADLGQQPQDVVPQQQGQAPLVGQSTAPLTNSAGENLQCQWQGCGERCTTPETLYEHVCERHVGRKSTNNLNLTCQWGSCRTTTVKRDHITSHIRVHVPLKPHKCDFCGKSFKRPQDLKKHVKTHADDSVIMRSPGPEGGARQQGGNYNAGDMKAPNYYTQAMVPGQGYDPNHQQTQYYQQQHNHQASQHPSYGPVTYYTNAPASQASLNDYESRKRGYEALDSFFGEVRRRTFDPVSYQNVSQRLYELQGLQLPLITQQPVTAIPAYQPVSALVGGGDYGQGDPIQQYSLPPMGNAKTRGDLTSIDQILEQMQQTIYENDQNLGQTVVGQSGAHYVAYRTSQSPPGVQLQSSHAHDSNIMGQHQHHGSITSANDSVHASTPGLTPPSSAQSYTSGHSPVSHHAHTPLQGHSSGAMYPTLPAHSGMDYANTSAPNAATLGSMYEGEDQRRRYSGGMLQRAQPARRTNKAGNEDAMDGSSEGSATPPVAARKAKGKQKKASAQQMVIDPALGGETAKTPISERGGEVSKEEAERQSIWVENMRLIEWMREFVKKRLESGDFDDENGNQAIGADTEMGEADENKKHEGLYPVLKAVEGDN